MKKTLIVSAMMFALALPNVATASEYASAQSRMESEQGGERGDRWDILNLTPEQEARFQAINARYAPARRDINRQIAGVRTRMNQELMKDRPNRGLLAQWAGEMGEYQKRQNISAVNHMLEVKSVLTPEQFQIFLDNSTIGGGRGERRRSREDQ